MLARTVVLALLSSALAAQLDRLELGLRLRALERHLGAASTQDRKVAALGQLDRAVQSFFRLDLAGVARSITLAEEHLQGRPFTAAEHFAHSLQLLPESRLFDHNREQILVQLTAAYPPPQELPKDLRLSLWFSPDRATATISEVLALPHSASLPLSGAAAGDRELCWQLTVGNEVVLDRAQGLSLVDALPARLTSLEKACERPAPNEIDDRTLRFELATLPALLGMLTAMTGERREETVLPGARLLAEAEAIAAALAAKQPCAVLQEPGEHWLRVPIGRGTIDLRMLVPPIQAAPAKRPLVLALHGAGGSENLFFDGYGDGALIRACAQRGWFVVAPRSGLFGSPDLPALLAALAARWPIDPERVFLVGHSMGAGQAVAAAARSPSSFAAVAALGGGGSIGRSRGLDRLPFFVGIGSRDFARSGAMALERSLKKAAVPVELHEYADVEHLAIVQFAMPDLMDFFERAAKRP